MPLHSVQRLSPTAVLGLWYLTETPAELWLDLPQREAYEVLVPAPADASRQAQWLAGRRLVHALSKKVSSLLPDDLLVQNDTTGCPRLVGTAQGLVVSLSHSGVWVAAVLALGGRVGVDVEIIRDKAQRLASKFLGTEEWTDAQSITLAAPHTASAHYTLLWSAKETLYKLAGQRGIIFKNQLLLSYFAPQESGEIPATLILNGVQTRHRVCYLQPAPGYVLTYCHEPAS
ncbi:4'-phosphopantetheinyl transferase family protein [Hymenobacter terrenus]|uniref:4'-phosphopantetheinyl transferase family protein n=1 Tax=Hymenobacter terrenus TaxID=1629124 RepID=UPI0006198273|nr:4'-phosphopantetheinyl transferase superfamily protein [Hymenobacter terrenus]